MDSVKVDGAEVEAARLAEPLLLDLGRHIVEATRNGKTVTQKVELSEGQSITASLKFEPKSPSVPPEPPRVVMPAPDWAKSIRSEAMAV